MDVPVIFEDRFFIIIDKPSGVTVNRSENALENTVQDWAEKKLRPSADGQNLKFNTEFESDFYKRAGIVHRLDKDTSGLLLIAKDENSFKILQDQFLKRTVKKTYFALIHGKMQTKEMTVKAPVGRLPWARRKFGVIPGGRDAETRIKVVKSYADSSDKLYTLVKAFPVTGRTHQIRIHLKQAGFPLVGDPLYSGRKDYREDKIICPRLFLHHSAIEFAHPGTGKISVYTSNLPGELVEVLEILKLISYN